MKRRNFIKNLLATPTLLNFSLFNEISAQTAHDYKALIYIFLQGGNDSLNMVIPMDTTYLDYQKTRSAIALSKESLLPLNDYHFGLHPKLPEIQNLFNKKECSIINNVGSLIEPVTKNDYFKKLKKTPKKLFSHSDQQAFWQTGDDTDGLLAKISDSFVSQNSNPLFTNISLDGNHHILSGKNSRCYPIGTKGAGVISSINQSYFFGSPIASPMIESILTKERTNKIINEYVKTNQRSIQANSILNQAIQNQIVDIPIDNQNMIISQKFQTILKIMLSAQQLGVKRQIFFVNHNGYDTHGNQLKSHQNLYSELSKSLGYLVEQLQLKGLFDKTMICTASDFGRTAVSNGDGTDHGWGAHHFILTGAFPCGTMIGKYPMIGMDTEDDVGAGRLIPQFSVEQYMASIGQWFGLSLSQLNLLYPNLNHFSLKTIF